MKFQISKINKSKIGRLCRKWLAVGVMAVTLFGNVTTSFAYTQDETEVVIASNEEKNQVRSGLNRYYNDLKMMYDISDENLKTMERVYNSAMSYMQNAALTSSELVSYEAKIESYLKELAEKNTTSTETFLMLSDEVPITSAKYNEQTFVVLSFINLGKTDISDVVVKPHVSNNKKEWPFVIDQAYSAQCIQLIQAADTTEEAYNKRMDIGWNFTVREDVLTGCYPLQFDVVYYQNGASVSTSVTTYINIKGSNPNNKLIDDEESISNISKPRIIVTGFTTTPETVYAGSVFNLNVKVQNTSADMAVENVLFNLKATVETGSGNSAESYAAFLPTSGSSSVYTQRIAPGETYEINIEMEAKADLSQKPYVLTVSSDYYYGDGETGKETAEVSIPVKQEAKMDTSSAEVMPEAITVGEQSNVMFSVYNTGKTTLYNVKVVYEGESVESGITYLGNIAPGNTGNVDSMVTGIAQDTGNGTITAVITYEDESGNETRFEKEINLYVEEMVMDDFSDMSYMEEPMEEVQSGIPFFVWIIVVVVVIIIVVVIIVIVSKKKKAKKQKEDIDLLDDEDDI